MNQDRAGEASVAVSPDQSQRGATRESGASPSVPGRTSKL